MGRHLRLLGITTCGELGRFPVEILKKKFGIVGEYLQRMGKGLDDSPGAAGAGRRPGEIGGPQHDPRAGYR